MEEFMSENNPGAAVQPADSRNSDQGREKRQRFDPSKQEGGKPRSRNQNHRRRNNGPRQGGGESKKRDGTESQAEGKPQGQQGQNQGRNPERQNQNRNKGGKFKHEQGQGGEKKRYDSQNPKPRNKRQREIGDEVAKNVKKVETIDDIRSDNARITKEIYLEIASLKNINLN